MGVLEVGNDSSSSSPTFLLLCLLLLLFLLLSPPASPILSSLSHPSLFPFFLLPTFSSLSSTFTRLLFFSSVSYFFISFFLTSSFFYSFLFLLLFSFIFISLFSSGRRPQRDAGGLPPASKGKFLPYTFCHSGFYPTLGAPLTVRSAFCMHAGCGPAALPEETPSVSHVVNNILRNSEKLRSRYFCTFVSEDLMEN